MDQVDDEAEQLEKKLEVLTIEDPTKCPAIKADGTVCGKPVKPGTKFCGLHHGWDDRQAAKKALQIMKTEERKAKKGMWSACQVKKNISMPYRIPGVEEEQDVSGVSGDIKGVADYLWLAGGHPKHQHRLGRRC